MTELLQRVIAELEKLPEDEQDAIAKRCCEAQIATRLLAELEDERAWKVRFESTLVAHADTVWDEQCGRSFDTKHELLFSDGIIRSSSTKCGIGADDRAGCAMLWLLKDLGHSLLITDGEELGGIGSNWLMNALENEDIAEEINAKHQFMIQLDRRHGLDFKCYSVGTDEFREYLERVTGYSEPDRFSYTDIVTLCRDITGVNLSVGYRNEHSHKECLHIEEWQNTLEICRRWLSEQELPRFTLPEVDG